LAEEKKVKNILIQKNDNLIKEIDQYRKQYPEDEKSKTFITTSIRKFSTFLTAILTFKRIEKSKREVAACFCTCQKRIGRQFAENAKSFSLSRNRHYVEFAEQHWCSCFTCQSPPKCHSVFQFGSFDELFYDES
jgi:hypothetical protein